MESDDDGVGLPQSMTYLGFVFLGADVIVCFVEHSRQISLRAVSRDDA